MKEQDYINAVDITNIRNAKALLSSVTSPVIDETEWKDVMDKLSAWELRIRLRLCVESEES